MVKKIIKNAEMDLINWLMHPNELGCRPSMIKFVKCIKMDKKEYYVFKFKKNKLGKWMLGVSGGYENQNSDPCGHTFSEYKKFNEKSIDFDVEMMVERQKNYWKNIAQNYFK